MAQFIADNSRRRQIPPASSGHGDTQAPGLGPGGAPLKYPLDIADIRQVQNPPPEDPPHGKDPRYWGYVEYFPAGLPPDPS
jgi:hypothetical protein